MSCRKHRRWHFPDPKFKNFPAGGACPRHPRFKVAIGALTFLPLCAPSVPSAEASLCFGEAGEKEKESAQGTMGRGGREERPSSSHRAPVLGLCDKKVLFHLRCYVKYKRLVYTPPDLLARVILQLLHFIHFLLLLTSCNH